MIQLAYDRAALLSDTIYVVTEASHATALRAQLPELPDEAFLIEPGRRGTAHCIIFALDYIARHHDTSEPIAFTPHDHHVRDMNGFVRSFSVAARISKARNAISLIGIEPTYVATGFGYIERGSVIEESAGVYRVGSFKEKPDYETATRYVESGNYLWNCGYFVGSVDTFVGEMRQNAPALYASYKKLTLTHDFSGKEYNNAYLSFDNQVIDITLIEKSKNIAMVSASFDWMDIGSFKDLHDAVPKDEHNNHLSGENIYAIETENAYVRNEEPGKPIAVIGLNNIVVVNTPNGLLVARKDVSAKCGDVAKALQAGQ